MQIFNFIMVIFGILILFSILNLGSYYVYKDVIQKNNVFKAKPFKYNFFAILRINFYPYVSKYYFFTNLLVVLATLALIMISFLNIFGIIAFEYVTYTGYAWFVVSLLNAIWLIGHYKRYDPLRKRKK